MTRERDIGWGVTKITYHKLFWNFLYQESDGGAYSHYGAFRTGKHLFGKIWWVPDLGLELEKKKEMAKRCRVDLTWIKTH